MWFSFPRRGGDNCYYWKMNEEQENAHKECDPSMGIDVRGERCYNFQYVIINVCLHM